MEPILSSVSFFCPAYHDAENLPRLIPAVVDFLKKVTRQFEIIIIEDGSPDATGDVADALARAYPCVTVVHHARNCGYGATLRDGFQRAQYAYVMYTDGDCQYDVHDCMPYLYLLEKADVLSGYAAQKAVNFGRRTQSIIFNACIKTLFFIFIRDINCSMKIYKKSVLNATVIKSTSAFIDAEMLIRACRAGFTIMQFPVTHYSRRSGLASGSSMRVIVATIRDMMLFRFGFL